MHVETVVASKLSELDDALLRWWDLLLAHAGTQAGADCLVADAWAETGRLIGLVQQADEPIGTDRGMHVVLKVPEISSAVQQAEFSAQAHAEAHAALWDAFERTRKRLVLEGRFVSVWGEDPKWICYYCEEGNPVCDPALVPNKKPPNKKPPAKKPPAKKPPAKKPPAKKPPVKKPPAKKARV